MLNNNLSSNTKKSIAFTAPHWAASQAGMEILTEGGTAVEAMVAAAAVITVVYPHMNSIGGDSFWLIDQLNVNHPIAIDACGRSASQLDAYQHLTEIPARGGLSALCQAGTIRGWQQALAQDKNAKMPLSRLLSSAITWAKNGFEVSDSLHHASIKLSQVSQCNQAFTHLYQIDGDILKPTQILKNPKLANLFEYLAQKGLSAFYQGELAESFALDLQAAGSPLSQQDLANTQANIVRPLSVNLGDSIAYNLPAPTQGVHSLQILAIVNQLKSQANTDAQWLHLIVEATKQSFNQRSRIWADPSRLTNDYQSALAIQTIRQLANNISLEQAKTWPFTAAPGDTVWMGAKDANGQMVSFIQSIYWEFGSGVAMQEGGFVWNNRGVSFSLDKTQLNVLAPNKKPAHTLNPAFAKFNDGRRMVYGTMGGEGQPQTQAAIFSAYAWRNKSLEQAIADDRWLLGRTWGDSATNLKIEANLANKIASELTQLQHDWQSVPAQNEIMGHAGAIVDTGIAELTQAASDPRSDGRATVQLI